MLATYLVCLIVGGVFVGLSVVSGLGKDTDGGLDSELGDADGDLVVDADGALDLDADGHLELGGAHGLGAPPHLGLEHGGEAGQTSLAEAGLAGGEGSARARGGPARGHRPWLPFMSFRFWTFGAAFFGLTGALLTALALTAEPTTLLIALALGLGVGTATSTLVHSLRRPVSGDSVTRAEYAGQVAELLLPLRVGATSKIAVRVRHREIELLATSDYPNMLPTGSRVVILRIDDDGRARVVPEPALFRDADAELARALTPQEEP